MLHFIVVFVVLNEINVCGGVLETPINKCSLLFIINIKASWSFKIVFDKGRHVLTFTS